MMKNFLFLRIALAIVSFGASAGVVLGGVGDTFTIDGIAYKITSENPNTVQVGTGVSTDANKSVSGALVIPSTVENSGTTYTVTAISDYAFLRNANITSLTIPGSITSIGISAFKKCTNIASIYCYATSAPDVYVGTNPGLISSNFSFYDVTATIPVYVPCGSLNTYTTAAWNQFTNKQEMGGTVTYSTNATISTDAGYCNVTVESGATLTVNANVTLVAGTLTLQEGAQFVNNGTANIGKIVVEKDFGDGLFVAKKWYPIGFPFAIDSIKTYLNSANNQRWIYDLDAYDSSTSSGDFWLKKYMDEDNYSFEYSTVFDANVGYAIQFPSAFVSGSKVVFMSSGAELKNITTENELETALSSILTAPGYYLVANPSTKEITLSTANRYYIGTRGETGLNYALKENSSNVTIKPFQSFGIAYFTNDNRPTTLRSSLATDQATSIALPESEVDADVKAEYYNLQGIRVAQPVKGKVYIEKRADVAKKVLIK